MVVHHNHYQIEVSSTRRSRSICACGWKSDWLPNSGIAGAAWDEHAKEKGK